MPIKSLSTFIRNRRNALKEKFANQKEIAQLSNFVKICLTIIKFLFSLFSTRPTTSFSPTKLKPASYRIRLSTNEREAYQREKNHITIPIASDLKTHQEQKQNQERKLSHQQQASYSQNFNQSPSALNLPSNFLQLDEFNRINLQILEKKFERFAKNSYLDQNSEQYLQLTKEEKIEFMLKSINLIHEEFSFQKIRPNMCLDRSCPCIKKRKLPYKQIMIYQSDLSMVIEQLEEEDSQEQNTEKRDALDDSFESETPAQVFLNQSLYN